MKNEDSIILYSDTTFMSDLKLNRDISLDFCTPLALRLIWCKTFISIGLLVPHYSGPDGSAAQPALLKIVLHQISQGEGVQKSISRTDPTFQE